MTSKSWLLSCLLSMFKTVFFVKFVTFSKGKHLKILTWLFKVSFFHNNRYTDDCSVWRVQPYNMHFKSEHHRQLFQAPFYMFTVFWLSIYKTMQTHIIHYGWSLNPVYAKRQQQEMSSLQHGDWTILLHCEVLNAELGLATCKKKIWVKQTYAHAVEFGVKSMIGPSFCSNKTEIFNHPVILWKFSHLEIMEGV